MEWFWYISIGFLFLRTSIALYNLWSRPFLPQNPAIDSSHLPQVSLLIPCRNEEKNLTNLLTHISNWIDGQVLEIIILDDQSTDNTLQVARKFQSRITRLKVVSGIGLPEGWTGKNWACHQLAMHAKGEYLAFIDADVVITPTCIASAAKYLVRHKLQLLSIFPDQKMQTLGEKLVVPLMNYLLLSLLPLRLVRSASHKSLAAANGQFMLFDAKTYAKEHFHEKVKYKVLDDVEIFRYAKTKRYLCEVLLGNQLIFCRMYPGFNAAIRGFSKNLYSGFGSQLLPFLLYLLGVISGELVVFFTQNPKFILTAGVYVLLERGAISRLSRQNIIHNLLLHPLQMVIYLYIGMRAVWNHYAGTTEWKGRKIYHYGKKTNKVAQAELSLFERIRVGLLVVLHLVGIVGFQIDVLQPVFRFIIPIHLLLISIILFFEKSSTEPMFWLYLTLSFLVGFFAEVLGVSSGILFGYYKYTEALGWKFLEVPVVIGLLWASLAYACNTVAIKLFPTQKWVSVTVAALVMTAIDFLLEPFAIAQNLWVWHYQDIPMYNYISWFAIGLVISVIYHTTVRTSQNKVALYFIITQVMFFIVLRILENDIGFF